MKTLLLPALLFCTMIISSCHSTTGMGDPAPSTFYLSDQTFDSLGNPSLNGWIYGRSDMDSAAHFSNNVPMGSSAKWSLELSPGWVPTTEFVHREFTNLQSGIYKLYTWAKVTSTNGRGSIIIGRTPIQPWNPSASLEVSDTTWKQYILLDTLSQVKTTDTVSLILTGGTTEVANWKVLYNNISFEKLP